VIARLRWLATVAAAVLTAAASGGAQPRPAPDALLGAALHQEEVEGDLGGAIASYKKIVADPVSGRAIVAAALLHLGRCYERLGQAEARAAYERVVREFADHPALAAKARARLASLGSTAASFPALSTRRLEQFDALALSTDGRFIAFTDPVSGDLAVRDVASGERRLLTHESAKWTNGFAWGGAPFSPDGRRIAYTWDRSGNEGGALELRVTATDGSGKPRVIYRCNDAVTWLIPAAWTLDGRAIVAAMLRRGGEALETSIATIDVDGGNVRELVRADGGWSLGNPAVSPDGAYVAYSRPQAPGSTQRDIVVRSMVNGRERPLAAHGADDDQPAWSPDGGSLLFVSNRGGTADLWRQRVEKGGPAGEAEVVRAAIGNVRLLGAGRNGVLAFNLQLGSRDVFVAEPSATGDPVQPLRIRTRGSGFNVLPAWAPDGRTLAMLSTPPREAPSLVLHTVHSGEERVIPLTVDRPHLSAWFPDGRSLLLNAVNQSGRLFFMRLAIDSARVEALPSLGARWVRGSISPDGGTIYAWSNEATGASVFAVDVASGTRREIARAKSIRSLALSRDGRRLAYVQAADGETPAILYVADVGAGERRELTRFTRDAAVLGGLDWAPDGTSLYVVTNPQTENARNEIQRVSILDGSMRRTGIAMAGMLRIAVAPDGRRIAFGGGMVTSETWVMENFLPAVRP